LALQGRIGGKRLLSLIQPQVVEVGVHIVCS
jgi:hypothetical protein